MHTRRILLAFLWQLLPHQLLSLITKRLTKQIHHPTDSNSFPVHSVKVLTRIQTIWIFPVRHRFQLPCEKNN